MGVEAVKQVALPDRRITGFRIKEANFLSPITFGELPSDVTESVVHLRFMSNTYEKESSWFGIAIYSYSGDHWTKCSTMRIQVQYHEATPHSDTEAENELEVSAIQQRYKRGSSTCSHGIETRAFYAHSQQNGLRYGDSFQVLREIRWDGKDGAVARIMPSSYHYKTSSLVHPAILDAALQISVVQTSKGLSKRVPTMVPSQMHDTWLSAEGWNQPQSSPLRLISSVTYDGKSGFNGKMAVLSKQGAPLFTIDKVTVSPLSSIDMHAASEREQTLIHQVQWNPQLSLQSPDQLDRICNTQVIPVDSDAMLTFFVNLEAALIHMSGKAVRNLNQSTLEKAPAHLRKLAITLRHQIESYRNQNSRQELSDRQAYEILDRSEQEKPGWRIFAQVARNLESIFRGSVDALDLIFTNDLADTYYRSLFDHCCDQRLRKLVELMAHENPRLQIIEVGAGTGAMTRNLLSMLNSLESETGTTRFESFAYTDISPSFFENAKNEFRDDRISFHTLDIERDPSKQGFQPSTYDLVIAGGVIHATKSLERTLKNVKSLLKPGGKLLFAEIIAPKSIHATVGFGILPGWWLAEEGSRAFSPCVSEHQWDEALKIAGFSGTDVILRDYETEECHIFSIMASTCLEQSQDQPQETQSVVAIVPSGCGEEDAVAKEIARLLGSKTIVGLREAHNIQLSYEDIVVVLAEIASPLLVSMDEQDFLALQYIISRTSNLIWVTQSSPVRENYPHFSLMTGFLRTLRLETPEKKLVGLSIESDDARTSKELASYISKVIQASFKEECLELEYTVREGHISTARVVEDIELDNKIQTMLSPQLRQESIGTGPPMVLSIGNPGNLDTLRFVEDAPSETELGEDELEVEPRAWSINFRDVIVALGRLPGESFGCDCAGVVTKVGRGSPFQPGDRVGLNAPACMRTCVKTTLPHAFRIPDSMGFNEAASFITPAATAYYCLMTIACLRPREKILIHSAAGATGQMAILIAQHCGAEIFATVGNDEKKELLITKFRIPPSHILYSRNTSFAKGISRLTGGKGVDVVLNSLSGESLRASFDCMAPYGRFIEIGKSDITTDSSLPMGNFRRNVSFFAVDLYHMSITKPELLADIMRHVMDLMSQNVLHYPSPMYVLPVSNIEAGFRSIQAGNSAGRFVIQVDPSDIVPVRLRMILKSL
jgi:NADPH:quinone reductase-like Zn-dependent oxidoreductase/SAM-dependent methyltransferase